MEGKLLDHKANDLLELFGAGRPTPGSGSAASLQAMLSAKLILTVIKLTGKDKFKPTYDNVLPELRRRELDINDRIYPELENLFQQDSDKFDEYIRAYKEWEAEKNPEKREHLHRIKLDRLAEATENTVAIAQFSVGLAEVGEFIFKNAFKDVRGDSAVALSGAIAALAGCISIVELNLVSFTSRDEWSCEVQEEISMLKIKHRELLGKAAECAGLLEKENADIHHQAFLKIVTDLRSGKWEELTTSESSIEKLARDVQNVLWMYRDLIWKKDVPENYIDVLKPEVAINRLLGYQFGYASLGRFVAEDGREYEAAGEIDKGRRVVRVSGDMRPSVRNFTAAHELGHALLHSGNVLHRDRPLDGSDENKDVREKQADKFAAFFLMPGTLVTSYFYELFGMDRFVADENTVFKLRGGVPSAFRKRIEEIGGLAYYLATVEYFNGRSFNSLAKIFNVSRKAMAIRLKELGLVEE
ncbi:cyclodeaminase/cyclohydrolase family protein [Fulvivirgaceae bacterium PWU37]|uniref:Cyclodeaminase/cyclohydrolase family protein n=2 Tax=Dawidia soli TaxID=2782352 RepID=A0AAP2DHG0_9BACT|nr:cyclodeaminase/cyclohydrolase family protein [Dawidia soli]